MREKNAILVKDIASFAKAFKADGIVVVKMDRYGMWLSSWGKDKERNEAAESLAEYIRDGKARDRELVEKLALCYMNV